VPALTCIRCFAVFSAEDSRPGVAPVCPACATILAAAQPSLPVPAPEAGPRRGPSRRVLIGAGLGLALLALAAAVAARWFVL
jgi:hypothetical protein